MSSDDQQISLTTAEPKSGSSSSGSGSGSRRSERDARRADEAAAAASSSAQRTLERASSRSMRSHRPSSSSSRPAAAAAHDRVIDDDDRMSLNNNRVASDDFPSISASSMSESKHDSNGLSEGVEVDDDEEEVELDSDLEQDLNAHSERSKKRIAEADQPQKCTNWLWLYLIGVITCIACELIILLPSYVLKLAVVGVLYVIIWLGVSIAAVYLSLCPGKKRPYSTLYMCLFVAAAAGYIGGMGGAYYYKQLWYFQQTDTAYIDVDANYPPSAPVPLDTSGFKIVNPTYVEFANDFINNRTSAVGVQGISKDQYWVGAYTANGVTYCAAPIYTYVYGETIPKNISYWAIGENCCDKETQKSTCPYWGENFAPPYITIGGEVLADSTAILYNAAKVAFMESRDGPGHANPFEWDDSLLIRVMSYDDHLRLQYQRRRNAWLFLGITAGLWPILLALFLGVLWLTDLLAGIVKRKPTHVS